MFKVLLIFIALIAIAGIVWSKGRFSKQSKLEVVVGSITLGKQECLQTNGKNKNIFKLQDINTTNNLDNLVVDLAVGVANQLFHKHIAIIPVKQRRGD